MSNSTQSLKVPSAEAGATPLKSVQKKLFRNAVAFPLVYVEWEDHYTHSDWQSEPDLEAIIPKSVGWLVGENERCIFIAATVAMECSAPYSNCTQIMKKNIIKQVVLRPASKSNGAT